MPSLRQLPVLVCSLLLATLVVLLPSPARALSCVDPASVYERGSSAFTGRIVDAVDGRLTVRVQEIWKGRRLPVTVSLGVDLVGWTEWATNGEVRDGYTSPDTWLFVSEDVDGDRVVNPCTSWRTREPFVAALRPQSVQRPDPDAAAPTPSPLPSPSPGTGASSGDDGTWLAVPAGAAALLLGGLAVTAVLRRRRR